MRIGSNLRETSKFAFDIVNEIRVVGGGGLEVSSWHLTWQFFLAQFWCDFEPFWAIGLDPISF